MQHHHDISGRSMRWYEWLLALMLLGVVAGVRAAPVYKCTRHAGTITYQDTPCAPDGEESRVEFQPAPAPAPSPHYALPPASTPERAARPHDSRRSVRNDDAPISYECRVSNGDVFYRHAPCPHTIAGTPAGAKANAHAGTGAAQKLTVSSRAVSRAEACAQIHRPAAIGRRGREHDDDVSTYDRNLGRDPCK